MSESQVRDAHPQRTPQSREMSAFLDAVRAFPMAEFERHAMDLAMEKFRRTLRTCGPQFLQGGEEADEKVNGAFELILYACVLFGRSLAARENSDA